MKSKGNTEKLKKSKKGLLILVAVIAVLGLCLGTIVNFVTDYWWFQDLGYTQVFFTKLFTQIKIAVPAFVIVALLSQLYLFTLRREYTKKLDVVQGNVSDKSIKRFSLLISALFSAVLSFAITAELWEEILYALNGTDFNVADPIFNLDISFYVFRLALLSKASSLILLLVGAFLALTVAYYLYLLSVRRPVIMEEKTVYTAEEFETHQTESQSEQTKGPFAGTPFEGFSDVFNAKTKGFKGKTQNKQLDKGNLKVLATIAIRQLVILGVIFLLMVGATFALKQFDLLFSPTGVVYGAGFTDINVTLLSYRIEIALSIIAIIMLLVAVKRKKYKQILLVPVLMIVITVATGFVGTAVQNLIVSPDEINKESEYLANNIQYTQMAYGLDDVKDVEFSANGVLTAENIANNQATISNIRINDFTPAEQFYNQTQSIRTYYNFNDVDVDRYYIDGEYTQTFLSAREMNSDNLGSDVSWLSQHLKYTHGYGITLSRVDAITATGQPEMLISGVPPVAETEDLKVTRPEIYFGESTHEYVITNTSEQEFDYPSGTTNVYTEYEGETGIELSLLKRIFYAIKEQNIKLLVSTNINSDSKILYERNIMDRVTKIAPFLSYDADSYVVLSDNGELYWMLDAYTTSNYYPYSEAYKMSEYTQVNYIRNPIKVVVNAYDGSVDFYKISEEPIADTLENIYPGLFKDISEMPADFQSHIRYSNTLFNIQAQLYQRYHMSDVSVFYQNEDKWSIATEIYGQDEKVMEPNYYIMKLPGEEKEEFINSIPYTPSGKKNMTGLMVARNDGEHYGELILYRLPKDKVVYGPMQVESQVDQNTEISKEFSLWNSSGSTYTRGDMFVIPIDNALLYVEPVYLEAANDTSLPEVKRVIVAYEDQIAYAPTLAEALDDLFGMGDDYVNGNTTPGTVTPSTPGDTGNMSLSELAELANQAYNNAVSAQRNGDWAGYGRYLEQMSKYLQQMTSGSSTQSADI
ncbi:MAG: UPF0182 family protein [Firmicutes bacterium]|nr:UPF0182 family protein [Bacillota bacterium]